MQFGFLFTNLLAVTAIMFGWIAPFYALCAYYVFSILRPQFLWFWVFAESDTRFSFWVGLSCLVGWAMSGFGQWGKLSAIKWPLMGLGVYLACGAFTTFTQAIDQTRALDFYMPQLKIGLMTLVTITLVRSAEHIKALSWVVCAAIGYLAWVFNSQYYFDGWNRIWPAGFGGVDNNGFAMIMVTAVPLSFFIGINAKQLWVKALCLFAVALEVHVILFSFSRGGQLGLCMVGAVLFIVALVRLPNKLVTVGLTLLMGLVALKLAGEGVRERFMSIFVDSAELDASAASRFETWRAAWECIKDNPLGVGPRNFNLLAGQYGLSGGKSVHNLFLQTGADYGILGAIGLFTFYIGTAIQTFTLSRRRAAWRQGWPVYIGNMVTVSMSGFLVCSTFIGMESVEIGFIICQLGLCTCLYVAEAGESIVDAETILPELADVPDDARLGELAAG